LDSRASDGDGGVGTGHLDKPANPPSHAVVAWIKALGLRPCRSQAARKSALTSTSKDIVAPCFSTASLHLVKTLPIIPGISSFAGSAWM
jgi:hypothetical protein